MLLKEPKAREKVDRAREHGQSKGERQDDSVRGGIRGRVELR